MIVVLGAGAVGCWVGGCLRAAGSEVVFVGRPRVLDVLRERGLTLTDLDGRRDHVAPQDLALAATVPAGAAPSLVLLTVKSGATRDAARALGAALPDGTPVLSLQNGVSNADAVAAEAPRLVALAGMVPFNVAELEPGHFHRGSSGTLAAQDHAATRAARPLFERARLALSLVADMRPVLWGKLLLNLNNPVNALSGLPLRAQLLDAGYRRCLAALQEEALAVLDAAGIAPARIGAASPRAIPAVLRLPTPLFRLVAGRMLRIDANARSSMADDVRLGRPSEIDALCGEVVRLAAAHGVLAPRNAKMAALMATPRAMSSRQLATALGL